MGEQDQGGTDFAESLRRLQEDMRVGRVQGVALTWTTPEGANTAYAGRAHAELIGALTLLTHELVAACFPGTRVPD